MKRFRFERLLARAAVLAVLSVASNAMAGTIALWTFETSIPATAGPLAAETGTGSATGVHAGAAAYSSPAGNGSAHSFSSNVWAVGDYYQFTASSASLSDISISWDQTRSGTGPTGFDVQYTTDGSTYQAIPVPLVPSYIVPSITWNGTTPDAGGTSSFSRDLSSITGLNNNSTIGFRLIATAIGSSTNGTNRVDNFKISSVEVPEPCAAILIGMAGLALVGIKRRSNR